MIGWLGTFALAVGFASALAGAVLWAKCATDSAGEEAAAGLADEEVAAGLADEEVAAGNSGGQVAAARLSAARLSVWTMAAGAACAVAVLEYALVTHDFSVRFVAENGSTTTPLFYTVTSLWASHDGSLMLWLLILTLYVSVAAARPPRLGHNLHPWAMTVLSVVTAFFFGLTLFTSSAFQGVVAPPGGGPGPNPLLADHPAMGIHPPLLYTGYLGLSVPFAYAAAALITGDVGRHWLTVVRQYTLFAWIALTAGIVMGAWWSYAVLGWGGYWAWDPVENASLMPWLVATALLHSVMVQRHRRALPAWNVALALTAFLLACLGAFLTRSGVVVSVHAFAKSAVGPVLLGFIAAMAVAVTVLVLMRSDRLSTPRSTGPLLSRASALLLNNVLLCCLTVTVLLGTLFPVMAQAVDGNQVSVGAPYYNRMAVPIALLLVLVMTVGPALRWRREEPSRLLQLLALPLAAAALVVVTVTAAGVRQPMPVLAFGLAAAVAASTLVEYVRGVVEQHARTPGSWRHAVRRAVVVRRRRNAGLLVHLGLAVAVVGIAASSAYTVAAVHRLHVGQSLAASGVTARLTAVQRGSSAGYMSTDARLAITGGGRSGTTLDPALRFYPAQATTVAKPGISSKFTGDVYATLLSVNQKGTLATIRLSVNPLVGWIWAGGAIMALGGAIAAVPGRRRPRRLETDDEVPDELVPELTGAESALVAP